MNGAIVIARFGYRHEAEMCIGLLRSSDIPAFLSADDAGGMELGATLSNPCRILVPRESCSKAIEILTTLGYSSNLSG